MEKAETSPEIDEVKKEPLWMGSPSDVKMEQLDVQDLVIPTLFVKVKQELETDEYKNIVNYDIPQPHVDTYLKHNSEVDSTSIKEEKIIKVQPSLFSMEEDRSKRKKGVKSVIWQCERIKKARIKGEEYINYKGNKVPEKKIGLNCNCCLNKCLEKLSEKEKQDIFNKFYSFSSKNEQDAYLQSLIEAVSVQRKRPKNVDKPKPHKSAYKYAINCSLGQLLVCKTAFLNLHAIGKDRVHRLCFLLCAGKSPQDLRGKNISGNSKPMGLINLIVSHISSFPTKEVPCSDRDYKYLSEKLDIKKMHNMFVSKYPDTKVKYSLYYKVFKEKFNLNFGRPQVDKELNDSGIEQNR